MILWELLMPDGIECHLCLEGWAIFFSLGNLTQLVAVLPEILSSLLISAELLVDTLGTSSWDGTLNEVLLHVFCQYTVTASVTPELIFAHICTKSTVGMLLRINWGNYHKSASPSIQTFLQGQGRPKIQSLGHQHHHVGSPPEPTAYLDKHSMVVRTKPTLRWSGCCWDGFSLRPLQLATGVSGAIEFQLPPLQGKSKDSLLSLARG